MPVIPICYGDQSCDGLLQYETIRQSKEEMRNMPPLGSLPIRGASCGLNSVVGYISRGDGQSYVGLGQCLLLLRQYN